MRGLRSTIALVVVLGGLFAYIYFVTWKQPASETTSKQEKVFASIEADKIDELRIRSESGDTTHVKKDKDGWKIVEPLTAAAQDSEISGLTSGLSMLEIDRVIDNNPANLKDYGLDSPRIEIAFKTASDKDYRRLVIGAKSPTGGNLFAQRNNDKRVFLIPAYQETTFNRSTFDLRDKTLVKVDRDKVDRITIDAGAKPLQFAKDGMDWNIAKPVQAPADYAAVEGLIGRVQGAQMKSIVSDNPTPADLKKYGLDKPAITASLNLGSATATLLIGGKAEDGSVYARDASKPLVATIDSAIADDLKKDASDYRRKDLFAFRAYNLDRLEVSRNGQTAVFEKVKGQGTAEDTWRRTSPSAGTPDKDKMSVALAKLESLRAASFVDATTKTGLDSPVMTVSAKYDDGKKDERVTFGRADNAIYAGQPGEPGAAKVSETEFTELTKALDEVSK